MIKRISIEIERRMKAEDNVYAVIGPEIRLRRLMLNKTLKFIAYKICSVSYVCKIERSDIKPNAEYLRKISKRLDMDEKKVEMLLNLREALETGVKSIIFDDYSDIKKIIDNNETFLNYRYKILVFLYETNTNNIDAARSKYMELSKISRTMTDYDFKFYVLVSAIFLFKEGALKDSYELLLSLEKMELSKNMIGVINLYLFYTASALGKPETVYYHSIIKDFLYSIGSNLLLDKVNYYLAIFYIKSGSFDFASKYVDIINDAAYKKTISFLISYLVNKSLKGFTKKNLIGMAKCIFDCKYNYESYKETIEAMGCYYQLDYSKYIFEYNDNKTSQDKFNYIMDVILKNPLIKEDFYLKKFFLEKMNSLAKDTAKYKAFTEMYEYFLGKE